MSDIFISYASARSGGSNLRATMWDLRTQADGTVRFIQNCPRSAECYPAR